jgi:hypothetical protein
MNLEKLQTLDKLEINQAREVAISMLGKKTKPLVLQQLKLDIQNAPTSVEVSRIMWQVYLSGSGLGTIGSAWKKHYNTA